MTIKESFTVPPQSLFTNLTILLLRVVVGLAFMLHGWGKIQQPFGWMGDNAFAPGFLQALAAIAEFCGGFALIVGLLTPLASLGIACVMAVAWWVHAVKLGDPFVATGEGGAWEMAALYFCIALLLIAVGPGRLSADRKIFGARQ